MDDPTAKFVLVAICNYADANDKAWPSHDDLARVTGLSRRAVQNNLKKLVDWGVVTRVREFRSNGSENNPSVYLDLESRPIVSGGVASGTTPHGTTCHPGVESGATLQTTDTKPHKDSPASRGRKGEAKYTDLFETQVWAPYPRKTGTSKKAAFVRFSSLSDSDQQVVISSIPVYKRLKAGKDEEHMHHLEFYISKRIFETVSISKEATTTIDNWPAQATRDQWARVLRIYRGDSNWRLSWGPEPGKPGCYAPADLIEEILQRP